MCTISLCSSLKSWTSCTCRWKEATIRIIKRDRSSSCQRTNYQKTTKPMSIRKTKHRPTQTEFYLKTIQPCRTRLKATTAETTLRVATTGLFCWTLPSKISHIDNSWILIVFLACNPPSRGPERVK